MRVCCKFLVDFWWKSPRNGFFIQSEKRIGFPSIILLLGNVCDAFPGLSRAVLCNCSTFSQRMFSWRLKFHQCNISIRLAWNSLFLQDNLWKSPKMIYRMIYPLILNFVMSAVAFLITVKLISGMKPLFTKAGLCGKDLNKKDNKDLM